MKKFIAKFQNPEDRKYFLTILGSKLLGAAAVFALYFAVKAIMHGSNAWADDGTMPAAAAAAAKQLAPAAAAAAATCNPAYVNPINTVWVLVTAFLVFFMQAGFMMLEGGFARSRETVNVMLEGIIDTCLCGLLFYGWGFAWMFGAGNGFIGNQYYFLHNIPDTYGSTGVPTLAIFLFQFAFADCTSAHYVRGHGRTNGLCRRLALQRGRQRRPVSDSGSLGLGSGWLAEQHSPGSIP